MARRSYRKSFSRRRRRGYKRRYKRTGKAVRMVRALSKKVAAEVRKNDFAALYGASQFTQVGYAGGGSAIARGDYALVYPVLDATMSQGTQLDDFAGMQVRVKQLYLGFHLQTAYNFTEVSTDDYPVTLRIMVIQDRNYTDYTQVPSASQLYQNIFGVQPVTGTTNTASYLSVADCCLLPINPLEPGRYNILRDFQMNVAPGYRQDYFKKMVIRQSELNSKGRLYFGQNAPANAGEPGNQDVVNYINRNGIYILVLYQTPYGGGVTTTPSFTLSVQSRLAYYDN